MLRALTQRDIETLAELEAATHSFLKMDYKNRWVMPMDCGGSNGSHHSYTLSKLAARGLAERKKYGGPHEKGSCRYRINVAGSQFIKQNRGKNGTS